MEYNTGSLQSPVGSKHKNYLDYLFYKIGNQGYDFELSIMSKDKEVGARSTKWRKYSELCFDCENPKNIWWIENVNNRTIFPNEVVLDLEEKSQLQPSLLKLKALGWEYKAFSTGSRGYHIHIFFNREISEKEKLKIIKDFGADEQKASKKCMIALEFKPHWKTGKLKELYHGN